jgi:hypothetical protein
VFLDLKLGLIVLLGAVALSSGAYFYGRWDGSTACDARHEAAALADYQKRTEDGNARATVLESELTASRDFSRALERQVDDEIKENELYNSCIVPANGVFLVNSALAGKPAR